MHSYFYSTVLNQFWTCKNQQEWLLKLEFWNYLNWLTTKGQQDLYTKIYQVFLKKNTVGTLAFQLLLPHCKNLIPVSWDLSV